MSDEADTLVDLIRQAHETTQELRDVIKEARQVIREERKVLEAIPQVAADEVGDLLLAASQAELASYMTGVDAAIKEAEKAVYDRFDSIVNIMLNVARTAQAGESPEDMHEQVRRIMRSRGF